MYYKNMTDRQLVELFHLLFVQALGTRVDRRLFALKGGCNLRFYWKSIRYSEDIDFDVRTVAVGTLRNNVERVLNSAPFAHTLQAHGLRVAEVSAPKQTQTTQRWKVAVAPTAKPRALPTKIEFSRRRFDPGVDIAPVDPALIREYRLYPVLCPRYGLASAVRQKVAALADRTETQARDVFDLNLLFDQGAQLEPGDARQRTAALENAIGMDYDQFAGQVVAYLAPEYQRHFGSRKAWEQLQDRVVRQLESVP